MSDPTAPVPVPPAPSDVKPTMLQATLTFIGGLVLAAGSCAGFLATLNLNRESAVNVAFALGFFASLLGSLVGVGLIVVRVVRLARRRREPLARRPGHAVSLDGAPAAPAATETAAPAGGLQAIEGGPAWKALVIAGALLAASIGFVVALVAADPSPVAVVFLLLAAASMVGSIVSLVIAGIRYGRGR
jgi:hypothetical protein